MNINGDCKTIKRKHMLNINKTTKATITHPVK